ncbi:helix-turn-helix domain-containing protein [Streptomyces sp. NPDC088748]|uniref:helix-turn-helix domain-containing protein n=1 Tax=Streptomyces sp. NPDC088748 TaxID=3365887 RepID=UPI0038175F2A
MTQQAWPELVAQHVAKQLRRHRESRGMSAQELSDKCAALGAPIQRSVIANFENGRRSSIGISEILVFAAALKIPPVWLITGAGFERTMEYLPGEHTDPYSCGAWFYGTLPQEGEGDDYDENPFPYFEDLRFDITNLTNVLQEVSELEAKAASEAPKLEELGERIAQAEREFEEYTQRGDKAIAQIHARLDVPSESDSSDELDSALVESRNSIKQLTALRESLKEISDQQATFTAASQLVSYRGFLAEAESDVRESIAAIRDRGWLLPALPESLHYLLKEEGRKVKRVGRHRSLPSD